MMKEMNSWTGGAITFQPGLLWKTQETTPTQKEMKVRFWENDNVVYDVKW